MRLDNELITNLIDNAIKEDIGDGDHSTLSCIPPDEKGKAQLIVKDNGVIAGIDLAKYIFHKMDPSIKFNQLINDGTKVKFGDIAFIIEGKVHVILQGERLVLNFLQRLSGIASQTAKYAEKLKGLKTKVLDTRKTTPGLRLLEKYAVKMGGGKNHRIGLYDMIILKDNHIDFAGGIEKAVDNTINYLKSAGRDLKIEVEARSLDDVSRLLKHGGIHRIMLDNFSLEDTRKAVALVGGQYETESSGGITLENLRDYAECGVDFVSVGALTHQIYSLDMSLKAI